MARARRRIRDNGRVTSPEQAETTESTRPAPGRRRVALFAAVATLALAADVVSKVLVVAYLPEGDITRLLGGALYLDQARNSGAAFSVGTGFTVVLTVIALAVALVIVRQARRLRSAGWAVALGLILGGALGNLSDRVFRAPGFGRGRVVDWISVFGKLGERWPIFNLADSAVVCGAILAAVLALRGVDLDGSRRG
jgi:signal peptidase II